jgi:hypothetical protein
MNVHIRLLRLTPTDAELAINVPPEFEVRGRLMGPSCPYSTTIEVAYHVRANRVIIPEPAWWDPQSPFLYRGPIELWREGEKVESSRLQVGLRHTTVAGNNVIHNGKQVELKLKRVETVDEAALQEARNAGFNAVEVPASLADSACAIADRIGLFVIPDSPVKIDPLVHPSIITR